VFASLEKELVDNEIPIPLTESEKSALALMKSKMSKTLSTRTTTQDGGTEAQAEEDTESGAAAVETVSAEMDSAPNETQAVITQAEETETDAPTSP